MREDPWDLRDQEHDTPVGRIAGNPGLGRWNAWVVFQGDVWVDRSNNVYLIQDISRRYAYNILRFLYVFHWDEVLPAETNPLIIALIQRIGARGTVDSIVDPWKGSLKLALPDGDDD